MSTEPLIQIGEAATRPYAELPWRERLEQLRGWLRPFRRVIVAYSGGVDSSALLRVAHDVLGANAIGVIGRSDSYAHRQLELALAQAATFGAPDEQVTTRALADPSFPSNPTNRCYHCQSELYRELSVLPRPPPV